MLAKAGRRLARRLPEQQLDALVRARHGELPWQARVRQRLRTPLAWSVGPAPEGYLPTFVTMHGIRARVVDEFDAHHLLDENIRAVSDALDAGGIAHVLVPQTRRLGARVAVSTEDRAAALTALARTLVGREWAIQPNTVSTRLPPSWRSARPVAAIDAGSFEKFKGLRVYRVQAAANGEILATASVGCHLEFWERVDTEGIPRPDGGSFEIGTHLAPSPREVIVAYLSPARWSAACESPTHWPADTSHTTLFRFREPIDVVYTWVDGNDPAWLARKAAVEPATEIADLNSSATHVSRFHSRDELRYSLRSVAMYASWVRKIYIVTDQQVPPWLNTDHPKIEVVDHSQIFQDPSVLPVFNSHAIESQLHHIEGLSDHYLYLNDDVFFGRPVVPDLFFHGNGVSKFFLSTATLDIDPPSSQDLPVMSAAKRNRELIEKRFGATVIQKFKHTPHPQLRSVLEELEKNYPDEFARVSASRFRHPDDLSITSALHHYYGYGLGRAMPGTIRYVYWDIARPDIRRRLSNLLRTRDADTVCLNDHESSPERIEQQHGMLMNFFERYFPIPSPFERASDAAGRAPEVTEAAQVEQAADRTVAK
jgi:hypothetical protein